MILLYSATLLLSAGLLFSIQPMFSKMVLPLFGGTPGVWNTCMFFYQTALLAGYALTHFSIQKLGVKRQVVLQVVLVATGFLCLPIAVSLQGMQLTGQPDIGLLIILILSIGWPFLIISMTAPMLQRWFAHSAHTDAHDPYFLYSASNAGSLIALLCYPILIEPLLPLSMQSQIWSVGYGLLTVMILCCAVMVWRSPGGSDAVHDEPQSESEQRSPDFIDRIYWFLLAMVPSSLLLGTTTYLTTDVAAIPLLWVTPLAIYMATFVIVFARRPWLSRETMLRIQPFILIPPIMLILWGKKVPIFVNFPIHLTALFIHAMVCHGQLARKRPHARHLTGFYLWIAAGGMAGGLFNALIAPYVFKTTLEYPLAIMAVALLRPGFISGTPRTRRYAYGLILGLFILLSGPLAGDREVIYHFGMIGILIASSVFAGYFYTLVNRPIVLGILFSIAVFAGLQFNDSQQKVLHRDRSFFGPLHVRYDPTDQYALFYHGTTLHGAQGRFGGEHNRPLTYFTVSGPLGQLLYTLYEHPKPRNIAITGLGVGSIAWYGKSGDLIDYYEIDPLVEQTARDERFFSFLKDCPAQVRTIIGDARLTLAQAPDHSYDLIIMDAFSSGSIPVHLLTREAFDMALSKMKDDGLLIYQITNRFINLEPVLGALAEENGLTAIIQRHEKVTEAEKKAMKMPSVWVVIGQPGKTMDILKGAHGWQTLEATPGFNAWTDDYSNLLSVIRRPRWD